MKTVTLLAAPTLLVVAAVTFFSDHANAQNVYVSNVANNRVVELSPNGQLVKSNFAPGVTAPTGLAIDGAGNVYVVDSGSHTSDGSITEYTGAGVKLRIFVSGLKWPSGLAIDSSGRFFQADYTDGTITEYDSNGSNLLSFSTVTTHGPTPNPQGVAVGSRGEILVCNSSIVGVPSFSPSGNKSGSLPISNPLDVACDTHSNVCVTSVGLLWREDSSGLTSRKWDSPMGLAFDSAGNLYIGSVNGNTITVLTPGGATNRVLTQGLNAPTYIAVGPAPAAPTNFAFGSSAISGHNIVLAVTNGGAGATYLTLASTNLNLPRDSWTAVATNQPLANGNFFITLTNAVSPSLPAQFFVLRKN